MNTEKFHKFPSDLMRCSGYVSKVTGELIPLSPIGKMVYVHMMVRNKFFTKDLSGNHYESQQTIADACCAEYQTVGKILRGLKDNGVISASKLRPNGEGQWRWFYHSVDTDIALWYKDGEVDRVEDRHADVLIDSSGEPEYSDDFLASIDFTGENNG